MRTPAGIAPVMLAWVLAGCSRPEPTAVQKKAEPAPAPKITQFYATAPKLHAGEQETLCYGVENATAVWLTPPRQILTASRSRCVEVAPGKTTAYRLTAEGADGQTVSQELTVEVGPARAKIVEVRVSTLAAQRGETVSICYSVMNTSLVTIEPIGFKAAGRMTGCATNQPRETTTYTVTAHGANGEKDTEKVTVKLR